MRTVVVVAARVLLLAGVAAVTWTSLAPAERLPSTANVSDKLLHFAAYALLGVVAALAQRRLRVIPTVALLTAFGLLIEFLQGRTGYRDFDLRDLLADALGAAFGVLLVAVFRAPSGRDNARVSHHRAEGSVDQEWDDRYSTSDRIWSGDPNGSLVAEVEGASPGRVLDVGCGEGADAIWLAQRGWRVTALDVSQVALDRAKAAAGAAGADVEWVHAGLLDAGLVDGGFDLVSAQYPALFRTPSLDSERALLAAVAPGGTLLVVMHANMGGEESRSHGFDPDDYVGHDQIIAVLDDSWRIDVDEERERSVAGGSGSHHTHDVVLRATRLR